LHAALPIWVVAGQRGGIRLGRDAIAFLVLVVGGGAQLQLRSGHEHAVEAVEGVGALVDRLLVVLVVGAVAVDDARRGGRQVGHVAQVAVVAAAAAEDVAGGAVVLGLADRRGVVVEEVVVHDLQVDGAAVGPLVAAPALDVLAVDG